MKKSLLALAVLASFVGAASAQSSVTLFGGLDINLRYTKGGGKTLKTMGTDGIYSSRWGVRGIEDLGGGLKAGFWLESAINPDAGTTNAARYWHRRTSVSLIGEFGEVRLGRFLTNQFTGYADFDPFGTNGIGDVSKFHHALGSGQSSSTRADNIVAYYLPGNLGGIYGSAEVAAGEGAVGNKYIGGRIGYAEGPLNVSAAYAVTDAQPSDYKRLTLAGSYDFGVVKVMGAFTQNKYLSRKMGIANVGAFVPVGPSGTFKVSFTSAQANGSAEALAGVGDATQIAVGYIHDLSKRTALYGTASRVTNKGKAIVAVSGSPTIGAGGDNGGIEVGIRHTF
jgi:predicted porin